MKDNRCAWKILSGECYNKDCDGDETCVNYTPMWYHSASRVEIMANIHRLMEVQRRAGNRKLEEDLNS